MQVDAQDFLPIAEQAGQVCTFDIEATGVKGDYNSIIVATIKPWHDKPVTLAVEQVGSDRRLVRLVRDELSKYAVWVSYYGKGFDVPMVQSRLLRHNLKPLIKRHHVDMYWHLKAHTITARRSQAHIIEWLDTPSKKMTLSPGVWNLENPKRDLRILRRRCEQDCAGLEALYDRTKHLIVNVTR